MEILKQMSLLPRIPNQESDTFIQQISISKNTGQLLMVSWSSKGLSRWGVMVICWDDFPFSTLYPDPVSVTLKIKPLPWMTKYQQRGGWWRPASFQLALHSVASQPLLPFPIWNEEVQQFFSKLHWRHFPWKINLLFHVMFLDLGMNQRSGNMESYFMQILALATPNTRELWPFEHLSVRTPHCSILKREKEFSLLQAW